MTNASILVADDEVGIRDLLHFELTSAGFDVTVAVDGTDAIAKLRSQEFDLVISDVRMPGVLGLDVLRKVKEVAPDTEVAIMTAFGDLDIALECLRSGASEFVTKPFDVIDIVNRARTLIDRRRLRCENAVFLASQAILQARNPRDLPQAIVETAGVALKADVVTLLMFGERDQLALTHSYSRDNARSVTLDLESANRVAASGTAELVVDKTASGQPRTIMLHPLGMGHDRLGVVTFSRINQVRPYRSADLQSAGVIAAQIQLAIRNVQLVEKMVSASRLASIGQLAAMIAHEINNPLSSVVLSHEDLHDQLDKLDVLGTRIDAGANLEELRAWWSRHQCTTLVGEGREALEVAIGGVDRIREIVRDVQSLATGDHRTKLVDVGELLMSAARLSGASFSGAVIETELTPGLMVRGSAGLLTQVFVNLIVNATQALAEHAHTPAEIRLAARRDDHRIIVTIADTGCGIAPDILPRIFEPSFTTKATGKGTGLGLSISRDIVRQHDGEISVDSESGRGTTVTLSFPGARTE